MKSDSKLPEDWAGVLADFCERESYQKLTRYLLREKEMGRVIYPLEREVFSAFELTPFSAVRMVILGQDPYHGPGQAHGLSFSVKPGVRVPPSLANIYKELASDIGMKTPSSGYLASWAKQGVFMLNSVLTVEANKPGSHAGRGWEDFTDGVIERLSETKSGLVFFLWGSYAHKKRALIDDTRHLILASAHPSPLSAYRGFLGSKVFSQANAYCVGLKQRAINWQINDV